MGIFNNTYTEIVNKYYSNKQTTSAKGKHCLYNVFTSYYVAEFESTAMLSYPG